MKRTYAIVGSGNDIVNDDRAIDTFMEEAIAQNPALARDHQVRWIGLDEETTVQIIEFIKSGEKVATFTLPWVNKWNNWCDGYVGLPIVLVSTGGKPMMVVQITEVLETTFGAIDSSITGLDGPPVRDTRVWMKLHASYWNEVLKELGMRCSNDMPVLIEKFKPVYPV